MPPLGMMNQMPGMSGMPGMDDGINLLSILINLAFGFIGGLMVFLGPMEVLAYGSKLAAEIITLTGYGQQMTMFGFAATAAPYVVLAPVVGMVLKQLSVVRSVKTFVFFIVAVLIGVTAAYFGQEYFASLMVV